MRNPSSPFKTRQDIIAKIMADNDIQMALRSGRLTARQLVQSYLDRINAKAPTSIP
jgi:hypothetical protein